MSEDLDAAASGDDPLRERLLDATAKVFAEQGYAGTKIMDIVRESGLSAGAVYGRFRSKQELLTEAVVTRAVQNASSQEGATVADVVARFAAEHLGPLDDNEAIRLEAYVAARREDEVADAVAEARHRTRVAVEPVIAQAFADGSLAPGADVDSILYFLDTMTLGLLLQRAAGINPPGDGRWDSFVRGLLASLAAGGPASATANTRRVRRRS